jgi:hypothetical protein
VLVFWGLSIAVVLAAASSKALRRMPASVGV